MFIRGRWIIRAIAPGDNTSIKNTGLYFNNFIILQIDALDESFEGEVVDIDRQSETVGGDVTYKVTIELDQQPAGLRWGMSAEVEIQTE